VIHTPVERRLHRLDRVVATVRIAREKSVSHIPATKVPRGAPVGDRTGKSQKDQIATRHERGRQAVRSHFNGRVAGQRGG